MMPDVGRKDEGEERRATKWLLKYFAFFDADIVLKMDILAESQLE